MSESNYRVQILKNNYLVFFSWRKKFGEKLTFKKISQQVSRTINNDINADQKFRITCSDLR